MRWRGLLWAIIAVIGVVLVGQPTYAEGTVWVDKPLVRLSELPAKTPLEGSASCSGSFSLVEIEDITSLRPACVYGVMGKPRMARYADIDGQYLYGFAYGADSRFHKMTNICGGMSGCVYSQSEDTVLVQRATSTGVSIEHIRRFSAKLARTDSGELGLRFTGGISVVLRSGRAESNARSVALSTNGRWATVEFYLEGLVRIDMKTGAYRWVAQLTAMEESAPEASLGLAVTNDGKYIAVTGWYNGVDIYEVDGTCGYPGGGAPREEDWCPRSNINYRVLFPLYQSAQRPQFSDSGFRLTLLIKAMNGYAYTTITPTDKISFTSPHYAAFGDSYTSGEGELSDEYYRASTNTPTNSCHVSVRSYPYLLVSQSEMMAENHACSGSRIADVRTTSDAELQTEEGSQTIMVSLGVGGNDIDLIGKMKSCLGSGTCEWAKEGSRAATANEIKRLLPNLIDLIQRMQRNSGSPMFLVGYPLVINTSDDAPCSALIHTLLSKEEREYIDQSIRYLNDILETAAQFTDVAFVNIEDSFVGERLCDTSEASMNGVRWGDDIAPIATLPDLKVIGAESFHPTPRGHSRMATAIENQLGYGWQHMTCESCQAATDIPSYWALGANALELSAYQLTQNFLSVDALDGDGAVTFTLPPNTFESNSAVALELHSEVTKLGSYTALSDGSLKGEVTLPLDATGYHTLHAKGKSYSGEALDIYQTVLIEADKKTTGEHKTITTQGGEVVLLGASGERLVATTLNTPSPVSLPEKGVLGASLSQEDATTRPKQEPIKSELSLSLVLYGVVALGIIAIVVTVLFGRKV